MPGIVLSMTRGRCVSGRSISDRFIEQRLAPGVPDKAIVRRRCIYPGKSAEQVPELPLSARPQLSLTEFQIKTSYIKWIGRSSRISGVQLRFWGRRPNQARRLGL